MVNKHKLRKVKLLPSELEVCDGDRVQLYLELDIWPLPCIQWQTLNPSDKCWENIPGECCIEFIARPKKNGQKFRAFIQTECECKVTNKVCLIVKVLDIIQQPQDVCALAGEEVAFVARAEGDAPIMIQWQVSTNGGQSFQNIPGENFELLTFLAEAYQDRNQFRAVFLNSARKQVSRVATLFLTPRFDFQVIHAFPKVVDDGEQPYARLFEASDGKLYGTTFNGGENDLGVLFRMNKNGSGYQIIHHFGDPTVTDDGERPQSSVIQVGEFLYGTTVSGGLNNSGTVYRSRLNGTGYEILHNFNGQPTDGADPIATLVLADNGFLYGTTSLGGPMDIGTVYKIMTDGSNYMVIHDFNGTDGAYPHSTLIQGSDGALYGTTSKGGTATGTLFKITLDMNGNEDAFTVLHNFIGPVDGLSPRAGVIQVDNFLYGTTFLFGPGSGQGTVYRAQLDGTSFMVLHAFDAQPDGSFPQGRLFLANDGFLYGTTASGGNNGVGTVFRLRPDGSEYEIVRIFSSDDGTTPFAGVIQASDCFLYGTTSFRGPNGLGTVYRL